MSIIKPFRTVQNIKRKPLNYDLVDNMAVPDYFTNEEVERIKSLWDNEKIIDAKVTNSDEHTDIGELRKSRIMFINTGKENEWIYNKLAQACLELNTMRFKFDIAGFQTELQLAKYGPNDFFEWHMDYGPGEASCRKLSITVQLSDPDEYEGGDLQFLINQNAISAPKKKGTAIIFPSYAVHRVLPITSGTRQSVVGWIGGAPYR